VTTAISACLAHDNTGYHIYDIGGPDQITFDELIDRVCLLAGKRRWKVHIPFGLALLMARVAAGLLPKPPLTISNVLGSNQNTDIDIQPAQRDFGFAPLSLDEGLARAFPGMTELHHEARQLARYLLGVEPTPAVTERYVSACRQLWGSTSEPVARWWRKHPCFLPVLDAAAGMMLPQSLLRKKVLLMAALLEATTEYTDFFLCPPPCWPWVLAIVAGRGAWAATKIVAGWPVLWWARRMG
jgi:hypothetical protein